MFHPSPNTVGGAMPAQAVQSVPFEAIEGQLRMDPGMAAHLEGLANNVPPALTQPLGLPPMDPSGRARWQAMAAQRSQMIQAAQQENARRKQVNDQVLLGFLQERDPLFPQVFPRVVAIVRSFAPKIQNAVLRAFDETPGAFLELYKDARAILLAHAQAGGATLAPAAMRSTFPGVGSVPPQAPSSQDPRVRIRQAVAGRMSAPMLENAGVMDDRMPEASRQAELSAIKDRFRTGKARKGDSLRYIELMSPQYGRGY